MNGGIQGAALLARCITVGRRRAGGVVVPSGDTLPGYPLGKIPQPTAGALGADS